MVNLKDKVKECLAKDKQSRNSDIRLTQMVWWNYHNSKIVTLPDGERAIRIKDLFDLPREDHISRVRRSIQEHAVKKVLSGYPDFGIYLPTDINVAKQRKMNEINWREYLGLN
ncbi:MAG: hypothetical protein UR99_C0017G0004 [Candidatus Moranbacteria bacterium GW2011_GWD2_36_12]|nr:MAG: hypothetical protein UR99_C0017G0004 [Candidatus Moranbacteria bacterium GW2011_GWD2_36_12]